LTTSKYILAIDLGSSGCKCAVVGLDGRVAHWSFAPVEMHIVGSSGAEQNPEDWWRAFLTTAAEVVTQAGNDKLEIVAICASTQGEGTVAVDRDGVPLSNALTWLDMRGGPGIRRLAGSRAGILNIAGFNPVKLARWIQLTGGAPAVSGKDPAGHMVFIKEAWPDIYEKTHAFLNVLDFINFRLTGRMVATRDSILTSWVTDNRDPSNICYHDGLIRMLGLDRDKLPEIVDCTDVVGPLRPGVAESIGLKKDTPVVAGSIDFATAAVGSGAVRDGELHLYIGTSSWMGAHIPVKKTAIQSQIASVPCARNDRYLMSALQSAAGSNLSFMRDRMFFNQDELLQSEKPEDAYEVFSTIAERVPAGARGLLYTPWLFGERCPTDDATVRSGFLNLSMQHNREDMIRAVMEGVALNTNWALQPVKRFLSGYPVEKITIIGGGGASNAWCQIFADVMNITVLQPESPIAANAIGSAFIAAVGLNEMTFDDIPALASIATAYRPTPEHRQIYDELAGTFADAYRSLSPFYRRLNSKNMELSQ